MKKNLQIIFLHLCLQASIGGLIIIPASKNFDGPIGAYGILYTYLAVAFGSIFISFLILLNVNKLSGMVLFISVVLSACMWFIGPLIYLACMGAISESEDRAYQKKSNDFFITSNLDAARQMGLSSYTWNPAINQFVIKMPDGKHHNFVLSDGEYHNSVLGGGLLCITTGVLQWPVYNDTLAWLKLTLEEASVYLNSNAYKTLDSCIHARMYEFWSQEYNLNVDLKINPRGLRNGETSIDAQMCYNKFIQANALCIILKYGKLTKNINVPPS